MAEILGAPLRVVNLGLPEFLAPLEGRAEAIHVAWRPPVSGDPDVARLVAELADDPADPIGRAIIAANARAVETILAARPYLVGIQPARNALP